MKNFSNAFLSFLLIIFCLQISDAQHFERNWQSLFSVGATQVEASEADDGWLTVVNGLSIAEVQKYDAHGNLLWNYEASFSDFQDVTNYTCELTTLGGGNYLFTVLGLECDIFVPTSLVWLDEMGQVLAIDTMGRFGLNSEPFPFNSDGIGPIVQVANLQMQTFSLWIFGDNHLWEYDLQTFDRALIAYEDIGLQRPPKDAWLKRTGLFGRDALVYLVSDQMYVFDPNMVKLDSFPLGPDFTFGSLLTDSSHLIVRADTVEIIDDNGDVLYDWIIPTGEHYTQVDITDDKIIFLGVRDSDKITTLNRFDMDLTNHEQFEWGNAYLQANDLAIQDSVVLIGGSELLNSSSPYGNSTPYVKTFELGDFSTSDFQKEAALENIMIDSLTGERTSRLIPPSNSPWNTIRWKFHNVNISIKNNGMETLKDVTVNWKRSDYGCRNTTISKKYEIDLPAGLGTTLFLGDLVDSISGGSILPPRVDLCVWLSAPDELLDADNSNDSTCETFPLRDVTSTDNIFTSNDLEVFPNPTFDFLNIDFKNAELTDSKIQIIDPLGRVVFSDVNEKGVYSKKLNVSNLSKGIYFLVLENEKGRVLKKWVKD